MQPQTSLTTIPLQNLIFNQTPVEVSENNFHHQALKTVITDTGVGLWALDLSSMRVSLCKNAGSFFRLGNQLNYSLTGIINKLTLAAKIKTLSCFRNACKNNSAINLDVELADTTTHRWLKVCGRLYPGSASASPVFMGTITDITEAKKLEIWRNDTLALFSHELKAPLTTMRLYMQLAAKMSNAAGQKDIAGIIQKSDRAVEQINNLMDEMLTTAVIENEALQLHLTHFNLSELINEVIADMQHQHPDRHFNKCYTNHIEVCADRLKIRQVLVNYLSNAVKYSPANKSIRVSAQQISGQIQVAVKDYGQGIAAHLQCRLFERYFRAPGVTAQGHGLGLYLVREIIEAHSGTVHVKSKPCAGATFYFSLPRS